MAPQKLSHSVSPWQGGKPQAQDEVDEIEVYGSEAASGTQLATYSFEVCDSILNIGPCANAAMGEPAFLSEEFQNSPEPDLEIVLCSGYGKNGALTVLQRSIRPQVVTTFELPGCYDMWTVTAPPPREQPEVAPGTSAEPEAATAAPESSEEDGERHGFLILSREDSTMILQTGQEILELDTSGFATQGPTVFAGNLGQGQFIVQVSPLGLRLLQGVTQLHFVPVDLGSPIVHCAVADPFGVLLSADGHLAIFTLKGDTYAGRAPRLALLRPPVSHPSRVTALCLYRDLSGMFTTESRAPREEPPPRPHAEAETLIQDLSGSVDDEEEMLYGDSGGSGRSPPREEPRRAGPPEREPAPRSPEPSHWCVLARENGHMEGTGNGAGNGLGMDWEWTGRDWEGLGGTGGSGNGLGTGLGALGMDWGHWCVLARENGHMEPSRVTALCLYRDLSGMFTTESRAPREEPPPRPHAEAETLIQDLSGSVDDEEEMLYGDSGGSGRSPPREEPRRAGPPEREPAPRSPEPSHWCVLARENGHMEIYQVPEWRLVFLVKNFPVGQRVLVDSSFGQPAAEPRKDERGERELPHVRELLLVGLGRAQSRPFLLVHVEQELLLYEAFAHDSQLGQSNLKVRFRRDLGEILGALGGF
ncbi:LOW QUALITY PROTEIN: cleavage and polyadenylation specificity factor subunit 1-like [Anomalospiza imberbis]|uniref:LOW QUALITY PROTEIN: cleavage and polyadenylation specificity factor subunit 1-like n=1 Tax=Anomalospiza imberbis TaxID=187417 RepID=UPI00358F694B